MSLYLTTPIFYVNAQPHLGHSYTAIVADTVCRFQRLHNREVFFLTGTDEHGDKVVQAAADAALAPEQYTDMISAMFRDTWPALEVRPDRFIRTTDPEHKKTVQAILQQVYEQGDIYFSEYSGLYCVGCERFLMEKELVHGNCPDHLTPPAPIKEQNYFFRMSKYQEWLIDHIVHNPDFITPERYRNEVLAFLKEPLEDLCISRPTSRLTWGIPLPFDERFVTYVWFDALINYLTGSGYPDGPDFKRLWQGAEHIIAKDILKPHAIYWPTMLKAIGLAPYKKLHVHGFWLVNETKMSKSIGNVIRPGAMIQEYGVDTFRYFLLREMSFGLDASFTASGIQGRRNSDLANDLGNLFSRSLTMVHKFSAGQVPVPGEASPEDLELAEAAGDMVAEYCTLMEQFAFSRALQVIWEVIGRANRYIVTHPPWELAKDPEKAGRLGTVLYHLLETLRLITLTLEPIMPHTAGVMAAALGGVSEAGNMGERSHWGLLKPGLRISPVPTLFPRLLENDKKGVEKVEGPGVAEKKTEKQEAAIEEAELISFDEFKRLDLRVAEIVAAERIKKSDRLLKLTLKAPEERTVVAGIAEHYEPEELIGRQVIIVANLKPTKLMGITSHGMVLAAKDGKRLTLSTVFPPAADLAAGVAPGSRVS